MEIGNFRHNFSSKMVKCTVNGCENKSKGHQMFRIPSNEARRDNWIRNCNLGKLLTGVEYRICDSHFSADQFKEVKGKRRLKQDAVPLNVGAPKSNEMVLLEEEHSYVKPACTENNKKTTEQIQAEEIQFLRKMLKEKNKTISDQKKVILRSNIKIKRLQQSNSEQCKWVNNLYNGDQIKFLKSGGKKVARWSDKTVIKAIKLKFMTRTRGYNYIRKTGGAYPSVRTLQRCLQNINCQPGVLDDVFNLLKLKVDLMEERDKQIVLIYDEMTISQKIDHSKSSDELLGGIT